MKSEIEKIKMDAPRHHFGRDTALLPEELQGKLHGSRVGLDVGDPAKLAARRVYQVGYAIGWHRKAETVAGPT